MKSVIPLLLFILGIAGIYVGTVQAAFTALMRLSQRLSAERSDPNDALTRYLRERFDAATYAGIELEINQKHVRNGGAIAAPLRAAVALALRDALSEK